MLNFLKKRSSSTLFFGVGALCLGIALLAGATPLAAFFIAIGISAIFTLGIASIRNKGRNSSEGAPPAADHNPTANLSNGETPAPQANPHPVLSTAYDFLCAIDPPKPDPLRELTDAANKQAQDSCDRAVAQSVACREATEKTVNDLKKQRERDQAKFEEERAKNDLDFKNKTEDSRQKMKENHQKQLNDFTGTPEAREALIQKQTKELSNFEDKWKIYEDYMKNTRKVKK